jgi:chromosome segregation ATPase
MKQQEIKKCEDERATLNATIRKTNEDIKANKDLLGNNEATLNALRKQLTTLNYELRQVQQTVIDEPADLAVYEEEIDKIDNELVHLQAKVDDIDAASTDVLQSYKDMNEQMKSLDAEIQATIDQVKCHRSEHSKHTDAYNTAHQAVDYYQDCANKQGSAINETTKKIETCTLQCIQLTKATNALFSLSVSVSLSSFHNLLLFDCMFCVFACRQPPKCVQESARSAHQRPSKTKSIKLKSKLK